MKNYRSCLADAYALQSVLEYLTNRADGLADEAADYRARAKEDEEGSGDYYAGKVSEFEAKAAAFERLIAKLSK